jgi:FkbM family methyltransferase
MLRRIAMGLFPSRSSVATVRLPWGAIIEVNPEEGIGRELLRQNIFDIAVSETAWRLLKPGDMAVDVGANIGYMTGLFAARVGVHGRVAAFEPHPRIFARLRHNTGSLVRARAAASISLHELALGNCDGSAQLIEPAIFGINEGASTVAPGPVALHPGSTHRFAVRTARFDSLFPHERIALLKVDVEGFEAEVLAGAAQALAERRIQSLIYEAHDCERSGLHALLCGYGYSVFGIGHDLLGPNLTAGSAAPGVDRAWESPSYLATLDPAGIERALRGRGWQVLRAC